MKITRLVAGMAGLLIAEVILACSCLAPRSGDEATYRLEQADLVVLGRVEEQSHRQWLEDGETLSKSRIRVSIIELYKGPKGQDEIWLSPGIGSCAMRFRVGDTYLIYAYRRADFGTTVGRN